MKNLNIPIILLLLSCFIKINGVAQPTSVNSVKNEILIGFLPNAGKTSIYRQQINAKLLGRSLIMNRESWSLPNSLELPNRWLCSQEEFLAYIREHFPIKYVEPNILVRSSISPNDSLFQNQWALNNMEQNGCPQGNDINVTSVWEETTGSDSVKVGVIDSGIDWTHPDLINNIWQNPGEKDSLGDGFLLWNGTRWVLDSTDLNGIDEDGNGYADDLIGWDFVNDDNNPMDDNGHGTHVAGIIGAQGNDSIGITGVCWDVSMVAIKALNAQGTGTLSDLCDAIEYSAKLGLPITNNSWSQQGFYSIALYEVIRMARDSGQLFIAAAGNQGNDINPIGNPAYPASYNLENIISVGAIDCYNNLPSFSNYGSISVDLLAHGDGILSTEIGNQYGYRSGTSMAAPFVAGAAALILSDQPGLTYQQLRGKLLYNTAKLSTLDDKCQTGGILNVASAYSGVVLDRAKIRGVQPFYDNFSVNAFSGKGEDIWMVSNVGVVHYDKSTQQWEIYNKENSPLTEFPTQNTNEDFPISRQG